MKWWQVLVKAISFIALFFFQRKSKEQKAKEDSYEKVEEKIDNDAPVEDIHSEYDNLRSGLQ